VHRGHPAILHNSIPIPICSSASDNSFAAPSKGGRHSAVSILGRSGDSLAQEGLRVHTWLMTLADHFPRTSVAYPDLLDWAGNFTWRDASADAAGVEKTKSPY